MRDSFVVAGGIVRNRAWILPRHLDAVLANLKRQGDGDMFYLTGDNTDDTELELRKWSLLWNIRLQALIHDTGEPGWTRDGVEGPRYLSAHMAAERNLWASEALKRWPNASHLWVVDSDVLPAPDCLAKLLELRAPVAAAFVPLQDGVTPIAMMGWDSKLDRARRTGEEKLLTKPHAATMVGACYLIERQLFREEGVRVWAGGVWPGEPLGTTCIERRYKKLWGEHPQGEDGHFAWFMRCNSPVPMLHHPGARTEHVMERDR